MIPQQLEIEIPGNLQAPGLARRALEQHLSGRVSVDDRRTAALLASELVTNAIRHTGSPGGPVLLVIDASAQRIRVEVHDRGPGFRRPEPQPHPSGDGGYGLVLVERMADRWGVRGEEGFQVWFELDQHAA